MCPKKNLYCCVTLAACLLLALGCKKEKTNQELSAWVSASRASAYEIFASDVDENRTLDLSVTKGGLTDATTTVTFKAAPEVIDSINRADNKTYKLLPESCYFFSKAEVTLAEGQKSGAGVLTYNPHKIAELAAANGAKYVLPVGFTSKDLAVNPDRSKIVYTFSIDKLGTVVFEDNFAQASNIPDPTKWSLSPRGSSDWNRYLSGSYDQVYVENGMLVLKPELIDGNYKTPGLESRNKYAVQYGKIEVRARFSKTAQGGWPAIWMMPQEDKYPGGWPYGGEFDIMEQLNHDKFVYHSIHSHYKNTLGNQVPAPTALAPIVAGEFNVYAVNWNAEELVFMVNGKETFRYPNLHLPDEADKKQWPFDAPFYIIFNYAVGGPGTWPGVITDSQLPAKMEIDWVRVSR